MPGISADDERRLAALPKGAYDALAPVLGEPAAKWTMAKADAVGRAVELTGVRFMVVPPAESLSPGQRAMLELCATHAELGLQGGVIYEWPRWSMRRWLGLELPGALEAKGADGRARWQRVAPSDRGTDGDAVRALLDELPMAERLAVFGEVDAGAYGLSTCLENTPARYAWLEVPGLDHLGAEGATWACAVLSSGAVDCWGHNGHGELGNGSTTESTTPTAVTGITSATAIGVGAEFSCAVASGSVSCWGQNDDGQLGNGSTSDSLTPVSVSGTSGTTALAVGAYHACALAGGSVQCWGYSVDGELGNGSTTYSTAPVPVTTSTTVTAIAAGAYHTCALLSDTTVQCWGSNSSGQLGDGTMTNQPAPVAVASLTNVTALAAGYSFTCALVSGSVRCWGYNGWGTLGNGTFTSSPTPVAVSNVSGATAISGGFDAACAIVGGGAVKCWGADYWGELGDGQLTRPKPTPVSTSVITGATSISQGFSFGCAVLSGGTIDCWGFGDEGNLGNGQAAATMATSVTW